MKKSNVVLTVDKLCHTYRTATRKVEVFSDVGFEVCLNSMMVVTGESGSGKSTLLLACGAMQEPSSGNVTLEGIDMFSLSTRERSKVRSQRIGFMFQTLELVPYLSVLQNVMLAPGASAASAKKVLEEVGLDDRLHHKPESLSHGQRQRAALARAIVHRPALLIADEPTGNLDEKNTLMVFKTLRSFADQGGAVLVATHEANIQEYVDDAISLDNKPDSAEAAA